MEFLKFHTATSPGEPQPEVVKPKSALTLGILFSRIISLGTVILAFLVPIFFLPITSEYYEFNKQALLLFATIVLTVAWFGKMWVEKEVRFVRTPLDLPILLLVMVYTISAVTSLNLTTSILGHFGRFNGGLVSIISYAILYFVYVNNVRSLAEVKRIAAALAGSAIVLALLGLGEYFNLFRNAPWEILKNRFFTPAGSPNNLTYFLVATLPLLLSLLAITRGTLRRAVYTLGAIASFSYIALAAGSFGQSNMMIGAWVGVAVALLVFFYFAREATFSRNRGLFTALLIIFVGLTSLAVPVVRDRLPQDLRELPREINPDWGSSWQIAASTLRDRPIQGSGPDTFLFDFTRFRDASLNITPLWDLRFDRANSELMQVLTTLGLLGLAAFLYFLYRIIKLGLSYLPKEKELETHTISVGFAAGTFALVVVALIFGYLSTITAFTLWISLAMLMRLWLEEKQVVVKSTVISAPVGESGEGKRDIMPSLIFIPVLLVALFFLFAFSRMYVAEATFQSSFEAARSGDGQKTYDLQRTAIDTAQVNLGVAVLRFDRDIYHRSFSNTNVLLASSLSGQQNPDTNTISTLVAQAIRFAQNAKDINPWDVSNWVQLANVYRQILSVQGSDQFAEQAYIQAINLDPTNVRLYHTLGTFYTQTKRFDDAVRLLGQATQLKPDLAAAHFDRGKALVERAAVEGTTKERQRDYLTVAKEEFEATLKIVTPGSADEAQVKSALEDAEKKLAALGGPASSTTTQTVSPTATPSGARR